MLAYVQLCNVHARREIICTGSKYLEYRYQNVCPIVGIGPPPPPQASVSRLGPKRGGGKKHSPAGEGVGGPN